MKTTGNLLYDFFMVHPIFALFGMIVLVCSISGIVYSIVTPARLRAERLLREAEARLTPEQIKARRSDGEG